MLVSLPEGAYKLQYNEEDEYWIEDPILNTTEVLKAAYGENFNVDPVLDKEDGSYLSYAFAIARLDGVNDVKEIVRDIIQERAQ